MKIDRRISELLYDHDCVIVPAFGGFLASYQSAQHQSVQQTFYPPSKKIAFNVFLKNNDGLLANHVAQTEKLTYSEALKGIEDFRLHTMKLLESGNRIMVEDVGELFYDKQNNLQFEPAKHINYLEEAFGLTAVQSPPVKREEQRKKIERQIRQAVAIRSSVKPQRIKSGKFTPVWKVFNTAVLSTALLWFAFNIYMITPHHANISSLNPFSFSSSEKVESTNTTKNTEPAKTISPASLLQKTADSIDRLLPDKQELSPNHVASINTPAPRNEAVTIKEETVHAEKAVQGEKHFFVIAGAFRQDDNAEKFVNSLKQEGFAEAQIINPAESFKKVCYNSFSSRNEAVAALDQIHAAKKEGWILKK